MTIPDQKRADNPAQPHIADTVFVADLRPDDGYVRAIEKSYGTKQEEPEDQPSAKWQLGHV